MTQKVSRIVGRKALRHELKTRLPGLDPTLALETLISLLKESLLSGNQVHLDGFGRFFVRENTRSIGKGRLSVRFKTHFSFKETLNGTQNNRTAG